MITRFGKLLSLALLVLVSEASAHQLDECLQSTLVIIEPTRVCLKINVTPGVAAVDEILARIDTDRDGAISKKEAAAYAEAAKADLSVTLDGRKLDLKPAGSAFPGISDLRDGEGTIRLEFTATPPPLAVGPHALSFENRHLPNLSVYLLNAAKPKSELIRISAQKRKSDQHAGTVEFIIDAPP